MITKALIAVRSGSQRVKNKNIKTFAGSNLLSIKIQQLQRIKGIDGIIVNSNSDEMLKIAKNLEAEVIKRDDYYATNIVSMNEVYKNMAQNCACDVIVFADATNPLILDETISMCLKSYQENLDIYDSLTGVQYLNLIGDIFKVDKQTREELIKKYADLLGLTSQLNNFISTYSHGMKQKLVIISSLIHNPKLLIMDEPFVGLDPKASFSVKNIMKEFTSNGGAIFFSTHVLEVAEKLCNKVAIIKNGSIIASGNMKDVKKDATLEQVFLESANE